MGPRGRSWRTGWAGAALLVVLATACSSKPSGSASKPASSSSPSTSAGPSATPSPLDTSNETPSPNPPAPTTSLSGPPVVGTSPGNGTPAGALAGFIDAIVKGQVPQACAYVATTQQSGCDAFLTGESFGVQGGPLRLGKTYTLGTQALVVIVGGLCIDGQCLSNADPGAGLPANDGGFAAAYSDAATSDTNPATGMTEEGGKWYVDLSAGAG